MCLGAFFALAKTAKCLFTNIHFCGIISIDSHLYTGTGAQFNPFRYRGYYYDADFGFYYLNSRYYDPYNGRFISSDNYDVIGATPNALTDKNLFTYCDNNPVMREDGDGEFWLNMAIGAVVGAAVSAVTQLVNDPDAWQTGEFWAQVGVSAVGGAVTSVLGPVAGAIVSGTTNGINSAIAGNDINQIFLDSALGATTSLVGSGAQLLAGRAIASSFVKNASKTQLKLFGNSLGYVGQQCKNATSWTGKLMLDAAVHFMDKPLAISASYFSSAIADIAIALQ